ncbi:hypothetical protein ACODT5_03895 [Streptomyces sp. 5.8]
MVLSGANATDNENAGWAVVIQHFDFAIAVAADGVCLVVPVDETTPWG